MNVARILQSSLVDRLADCLADCLGRVLRNSLWQVLAATRMLALAPAVTGLLVATTWLTAVAESPDGAAVVERTCESAQDENQKTYQAEKERLNRDHHGQWMVIANGKVHGPFESISKADEEVPAESRLIFRPGIDDGDIEFPLSPFVTRSEKDWIQFGRQLAKTHKLSITSDQWSNRSGQLNPRDDGRAPFSLAAPDNSKQIQRHAVCSGLFQDELTLTENEVRELDLAKFRVPGVATYSKDHPGYKVFVKVSIPQLKIEQYMVAYVLPDSLVKTVAYMPDEAALREAIRKMAPAELKKDSAQGNGDSGGGGGAGSEESSQQQNKKAKRKHRWKLFGQVTDQQGDPLGDVEVKMATGMATLLGGGQTKTDANGNYQLEFGEGIYSTDPDSACPQVAWCFVSKAGYVYKSNSREVDLSMMMARKEVPIEDLGYWAHQPDDQIIRDRPHKFDIVMGKPAEILVSVYDEQGSRVTDSGIQLDDALQTSEVTDISISEEEKDNYDILIGIAPHREWTLSVPGTDDRVQTSPLSFTDPGRFLIRVTRSGEGDKTTLTIEEVRTADGREVTDKTIVGNR